MTISAFVYLQYAGNLQLSFRFYMVCVRNILALLAVKILPEIGYKHIMLVIYVI